MGNELKRSCPLTLPWPYQSQIYEYGLMDRYQASPTEAAEPSSGNQPAPNPADSPETIKGRFKKILFRAQWQLAGAVAGSVITLGVSWSRHWPTGVPVMKDLTEFLTVLVGISTILAVVASVTFSFLLYLGQAFKSENLLLFDRYRANVKEVRDYFNALDAAKLISGDYEVYLMRLEGVHQNDLPFSTIGAYIDAMMKQITDVDRARLEAIGAYDRVSIEAANLLAQVWDTSMLLFTNWGGRILINTNRSPSQKCFATLAILTILLLISVIYYEGFMAVLLDAFAVGAGIMTTLLLIEFSLIATREFNSFEMQGMRPWLGHEDAVE
jgi:hypothetical protein